MKRIVLFLSCLFLFATGAMAAGSAVQVPTLSGSDVLLPKKFIDTITTDVKAPVVAVMHDAVGEGKEVPMVFDGTNWVAKGAKGADFHPALKTKDGYVWAKIENVWSTSAAFVGWRDGRVCVRVLN